MSRFNEGLLLMLVCFKLAEIGMIGAWSWWAVLFPLWASILISFTRKRAARWYESTKKRALFKPVPLWNSWAMTLYETLTANK